MIDLFVKNLKYLILILSLLLISCNYNKDERLQPSKLNSKFTFDISKTFKQYVDYSQKLIAMARVDLNQNNKLENSIISQNQIISWNSPFILNIDARQCPGEKKGILLIHGLSDSPFTTRTMAEYFNDKCFIVYSILLTGHGTRPGDLLEVSYEDWVSQVEYGVNELAKEADKIYLGGYSTGGALAVNYILSNPKQKIAAFIGLVPALNLDFIAAFAPILKYFKDYLDIHQDQDVVKYESFTTNAASQIYLLSKEIQKKLDKDNSALKDTKIFAALTYEDTTINAEKTLQTIINNSNPDNRHIIVYHQNELPKNLINQKNIYPFNSTIETEKILNLAHVSLAHRAKNEWYGKNGQYRNCLHYDYEDQNYDLCQSSQDIYYGEVTDANLKKGIVARLSYNPFMDQLLEDLSNFLDI